MPKMPPRKRQADSDNSSDEDYRMSTQSSTSSSASRKGKLGREDIDELANKLVQYVLITDRKKNLIRRTAINKHLVVKMGRQFLTVLDKAQATIKEVYGFRIVPHPDNKEQFMLIRDSVLGENEHLLFKDSNKKKSTDAVRFLVLALIYMLGGTVQEEVLMRHLKTFGIDPGTSHKVVGNIQRFFKEDLIKRQWIELKPIENVSPTKNEVSWGRRAELEVDKMQVLELVAQILQDTKKEDWTAQYRMAHQQKDSW